jgi:hypothetical protein
MIVIDVLRTRPPAHRTLAALLGDQRIDLIRADAVATLEVVMPRASIESFPGFSAARVVARLAVGVPPIPTVPIARELFEGFPFVAVRTPLHDEADCTNEV